MNLIGIDPDVERAWVAALSVEQIDDPMNTTPSDEKQANYDSDSNIMMNIARTI